MRRRGFLTATIGAAALAGCGAGAGGGGPSGRDVHALARSQGLDSFLRAADAAGLTPILQGGAQITVFAPTDRAFARLPGGLNGLLRSDDLKTRMAHHIVPGAFNPSFFEGRDMNYTATTGGSVKVDGTGDAIRVDGARVIGAGREGSNGVLYVIDTVLRT